MLPLMKEQLKSHQDAKVCYICGKRILKGKIVGKFEVIATIQVNIEVQHIVYVIQDLMCLMKFL